MSISALFLALHLSVSQPCVPFAIPNGPLPSKPLLASGKGLWIGGVAFPREEVTSASTVTNPLTGGWAVALKFSDAGNSKLIAIEECNLYRLIEISVDGRVLARPFVNTVARLGTIEIVANWRTKEEAAAAIRPLME
jgi:hypothetical protein